MHLKLRHLEVLRALMEAGSVSQAAQKLNVTQPAVSVALANLERDLGFRLFNRAKGFFAPTPEAHLLNAEAERGLIALARVERRAAEIRAGTTGNLSIASNGAMAINLLPRLIAELQAETPGLNIDLSVHGSRQVAALVSGGQIDIGLIDTPVPVAGLVAEIFRLPCVCILRADDPLTKVSTVTPDLIAGRPVIAITGEHAVDRQLDGLLATAKVRVERRTSCSYFAIARSMVAAGGGLALIDGINARLALNDGVIWRPFAPQIDYELAMIVAAGPEMHHHGARFIARLKHHLASG
ncbi:MAG: LysR substrate-binding domain-containing protein [Pseudomonadota bacterium]